MKKLSVKIILINLLIFAIIFGLFFLITSRNLRRAITIVTNTNLEGQVANWAKEFDAVFSRNADFVLTLRAYLEENLTPEILKDDQAAKAVFDRAGEYASATVRSAQLLNLYSWLAPEEVDNFFGLSVRNVALDGNVESYYPEPYGRDEITGPNWEWFWGAEQRGLNITEPYFWEGYEGQLVSYTEQLVVGGRTVGIVGTDMFVGEFENALLEERILETGFFALSDSRLNFIFHPEAAGESISTVFPLFSDEDYRTITEDEFGSGVLSIGRGSKLQLIAYQRLFNGWYLLGFPTTSEIYAGIHSLTRLLLVLLVGALILVTIAAVFMGVSISRPLRKVAENLSEIAQGGGDLTKTLDIQSKDETGQLAGHFNNFVASLRSILGEVQKSYEESLKVKDELSTGAESAMEGLGGIRTQSEAYNKALENLREMISNVSSATLQISGNIESFNKQIENQVSAVEESTASVEEMIAALNNVNSITREEEESTRKLQGTTEAGVESMRRTSVVIQEINQSVGAIMEMTALINNIASQTNLLSMNAAIEAAHAGDAGKGFSVVAEEIRKLAESASESSNKISQVLKTMVDRISVAVTNSNKTSSLFEEIRAEVDIVARAFSEISGSTEEISAGGKEILKAMAMLTQISTEVKNGSQEMKEGTSSVAHAMDEIHGISERTSEMMERILQATETLKGVTDGIVDSTERLDGSVQSMGEKISRFTL